jgi:hypothetical protein
MTWNPSTQNNRRPPDRTARDRIAPEYIRENFESDDRLAVVLLNKRSGEVIQRIATADRIAADDFEAWLRFQNSQRYEVYISMNALGAVAKGRTKADVAAIRHVYLDFDKDGTAAVEKLLARKDLPPPNYLINPSPDKWQVVWKVAGFGKDQAEHLQQVLVQDTGADPAATDCSRVLRLPGFFSHKYSEPFWVASQTYSQETYTPERFPQIPPEGLALRTPVNEGHHKTTRARNEAPLKVSQSERDWAYAKRALARGEGEENVIVAIASFRRYDKHNPQDYAQRTVQKAAESLRAEAPDQAASVQPER